MVLAYLNVVILAVAIYVMLKNWAKAAKAVKMADWAEAVIDSV